MPIQKKFHKISWTRRMIIALIVATVMPAVIISSIIFNVAAKNLEKQAYELTDYKITQRVRFLELDLRQVFDLIYQTVVDPAVAGAMDSLNRGREPVESKTTLRSKFISYGQMLEAVQSMTYIDNQGENYYTYEKFNSVYDNNMWSDKKRRLGLCSQTKESESAVFLPTIQEELAGGRQIDLFYIAIPISHINAFLVFFCIHIPVFKAKRITARIVFIIKGPGIRQFAAWCHFAGYHVRKGIAALLPCLHKLQHSFNIVKLLCKRQVYKTSCIDHQNKGIISL